MVRRSRLSRRSNWLVRVYDKKSRLLDRWIIENRLEREAEGEALADVEKVRGYDDWTMVKVPRREK
jgi:hypothetical protein